MNGISLKEYFTESENLLQIWEQKNLSLLSAEIVSMFGVTTAADVVFFQNSNVV